MRRLLLALPLVLFAGLAALFAFRVTDGEDRTVVPSPLVGRAAPEDALPALLDTLPGFDPAALEGRVTLVNVFGSWCPPCRVEHPFLMELAETPGLTMAGFNWKDRVPAARAFLDELGNPYDVIGMDPEGRRAIDWGVYGAPETFLVGPDGVIRAKHVGVLSPEVMAGDFGETMRALLDEAGAPAS